MREPLAKLQGRRPAADEPDEGGPWSAPRGLSSAGPLAHSGAPPRLGGPVIPLLNCQHGRVEAGVSSRQQCLGSGPGCTSERLPGTGTRLQ